jgi:hypothetical protein
MDEQEPRPIGRGSFRCLGHPDLGLVGSLGWCSGRHAVQSEGEKGIPSPHPLNGGDGKGPNSSGHQGIGPVQCLAGNMDRR